MSEPAAETQTDTPAAGRLVIRIKLEPQESPPPPPARTAPSRGAQLAIVGIVVAVLLGWFGIDSLESDPPPPAPAVTAKAPVTAAEPAPKPVEPEQPDPPPSAVNEVVPDVPQSALDTIRGTIRVIVRMSIDQQGTVVATTADVPGPSRYFELLSVEAAKKWTFTPARSEDRRTMLVQFNFTRDEATASASPAPK